MGTLTVQYIADGAWILLHDTVGTQGVRWPEAQILRWFNEGQRDVVLNLPSAYTKRVVATPAAGTRQTLEGMAITDGLQPLRIPRNFAADGTTPGRAVTPKPMAFMDENQPDWHSQPAGPAVHWFFDSNDPKAFYVWPPANGTAKLEVVYAAVPPLVTSVSSVMTLDDIYANPLSNYIIYRAKLKGASYTKNNAEATMYYQLYLQSLGIKDARVKALDANRLMLSDGGGVAEAAQ